MFWRPLGRMKKLPFLFIALSAFTLVASNSAFAAKKTEPKETKAAIVEKYDKNHNGKLDADELAQIRSDFLADPKGELKKFDTDQDGKLSDTELAAINGKKGEKAGGKKKKNGVE